MSLITVIMSVYNGEPYLSESIQSILDQTFNDFEFIIINDGSTDKSWDTILNYSSKDKRVIPLKQKNIGLTKSLNKGIKMSNGLFIARQDSDDISNKKRFEKQIPWLLERNYDLCCSRSWLIEKMSHSKVKLLVAKTSYNA